MFLPSLAQFPKEAGICKQARYFPFFFFPPISTEHFASFCCNSCSRKEPSQELTAPSCLWLLLTTTALQHLRYKHTATTSYFPSHLKPKVAVSSALDIFNTYLCPGLQPLKCAAAAGAVGACIQPFLWLDHTSFLQNMWTGGSLPTPPHPAVLHATAN